MLIGFIVVFNMSLDIAQLVLDTCFKLSSQTERGGVFLDRTHPTKAGM